MSSCLKVEPIMRSHMMGVIDLLQQISSFRPPLTQYESIWENFERQGHVFSVVATSESTVIGYGSLILEQKIRGGIMGHIEDIVVSPSHGKKGIGRLIVESLCEIALKKGCYKVALQCQDRNLGFYKKCGFEFSGTMMQRFVSSSNFK